MQTNTWKKSFTGSRSSGAFVRATSPKMCSAEPNGSVGGNTEVPREAVIEGNIIGLKQSKMYYEIGRIF